MKKYDWIGLIAYNEKNGLYYSNLFKFGAPRKEWRDRPRPVRYVGFLWNGEEHADDAVANTFESLAKEGVSDPERAIISSNVVPVQSVHEMDNIFRKIGVCSSWNGKGSVQPSNICLQRGPNAGEPLGMLPVSEIENGLHHFDRYIVITHHRALKSYIPVEFWSGAKGYARTRPFNTYYLIKASECSCATAQDAYELAMEEHKSARTPRDILDTHVLSVNSRDDLIGVHMDVARDTYDSALTFDRIRRVSIDASNARNCLVPIDPPIRPDQQSAHGEKGNPFALRGASRSALVRGS